MSFTGRACINMNDLNDNQSCESLNFETNTISADKDNEASSSSDELTHQQKDEIVDEEDFTKKVSDFSVGSDIDAIEIVKSGTKVVDSSAAGDDLNVTSEADFKAVHFSDAFNAKNADCTEKDSTVTKTYSSAIKKGKVSFKIDDSDNPNQVEEASTSQVTKPAKAKLTPKMLNRMKTLLLQKIHNSGKDDFYIGDLINAVEGELMNLPPKRKRSSKREARTKHLTKSKIRSINTQRRNMCMNMQVLSSSISTEFVNMDEFLLNLRQVCIDFNAEFNQPHTPLGEPNAANLGMNELFVKIKEYLPLLQDSFKEVKHCSRLFIRADMTLTDNLYNIVQTYFGDRLKDKHIPRVRYSEVLKIFMDSNRQHCQLDIDANAMDETSYTSLDQDKI